MNHTMCKLCEKEGSHEVLFMVPSPMKTKDLVC